MGGRPDDQELPGRLDRLGVQAGERRGAAALALQRGLDASAWPAPPVAAPR